MNIFPIYSPIIPKKNSWSPVEKVIREIIVAQPKTATLKKIFCIVTTNKYKKLREEIINPTAEAILNGLVENESKKLIARFTCLKKL